MLENIVDIDIDHAVVEALEWLYEQSQGQASSFLDVNELRAEWNKEDAAYLVTKHAENRGLVKAAYTLGGGVQASLTSEGIAFVQRARNERMDPSARVPAIRRAMLQWLYSEDANDSDTSSWDGFLSSSFSLYFGQRFSQKEVFRQAVHLHRSGLVEAITIEEEAAGLIEPRLSSSGHDCVVEFGGNVSEYLNRQARVGNTSNVYIADNRGNLSVGGSNFTQNSTTGVDTSELLQFAGAVRQILPTLDLPPEVAGQLDQDAIALHEEASQAEPNVGLITQLWRGVMSGLTSAAPTVTGDLVQQLGNEAIKTISG